MRKYKQVKEKKVIYSLPEWDEIERRASEMSLKTGTYIKRISVNGQITHYDMKEVYENFAKNITFHRRLKAKGASKQFTISSLLIQRTI